MKFKKKSLILAALALLLIPTVFYLVATIKDLVGYNKEISAMQKVLDNVENETLSIQLLPNGNPVVFLKGTHDIIVQEWDPISEEVVQEQLLESDIFKNMAIARQQDGLVIVTTGGNNPTDHPSNKGNALNIYYYESNQPIEIIESEPIFITTYLNQTIQQMNQDLFILGKNAQENYVAATVQNGKIDSIQLSTIPEFEQATNIKFSRFSTVIPILEISTYSNESYVFGLLPDKTGQLPVSLIENPHHNPLATFYFSEGDILIKENKQQLVQYDLLTNSPIEPIVEPFELYYPKAFQLDKLTVILGRTAVAPSSAVTGYITNLTGQQLLMDLQPFSQDYPHFFESFEKDEFSIQEVANQLYFSSPSGAAQLDVPTAQFTHFERTKYAELLENKVAALDSKRSSLVVGKVYTMMVYLSKNNPILLIVIALLSIFALTILLTSFFASQRLFERNHRVIVKALKNGAVEINASALSVKQTGMYVNEQPQVRMKILFVYNFEKVEKEVKVIVSLINPPCEGDKIPIVYDPVKDKVYLISE